LKPYQTRPVFVRFNDWGRELLLAAQIFRTIEEKMQTVTRYKFGKIVSK
jgi:hypothetical protein